jgi:predicted DNA-binding protein (MmcQ/YjbR family)
MDKLETIVGRLPQAVRVDIEAWDGEPTFRVNGKNFVFSSPDATSLTVKLPLDEARAIVASDARIEPAGYGLGRHGWVTITVPMRTGTGRWAQIEEWVRTSYTLVAPKRLARQILDEDAPTG